MHILLIEDDPMLGDSTTKGLTVAGYQVTWVKEGEQGQRLAQTHEYDLILLDLGLPGVQGDDVLRSLRDDGHKIPVLILTARNTINDKIKTLDLGADDYLEKPFDFNELAARIRALSRRIKITEEPSLQFKALRLNVLSRSVYLNNHPIEMPRREFVLLKMLMENIGRVLSKQQIEDQLYGWEIDVGSNTVEVHIHNLRKKFGSKFIRTLRGVGYLLDPKTAQIQESM